ncbi:MAG: HAMP domain-containing histidine kinase [Verrucomicrobia bacterium]|nr:HAMP domain-containing histidine kinase [Verrucomicrobiota bacterium]
MPRDWLDAEVEVTGVCQTGARDAGHPYGFTLYGSSTNMVKLVSRSPSSNLFGHPALPIAELSSLRVPKGHRVRLQGTVTLHQPSGPIFIQDASGAVEVQPMAALSGLDIQEGRIEHPPRHKLSPGDRIEVIGTPVRLPRGLILGHAEYQRISIGPEIPAVAVRVAELLNGSRLSQLVTLRARLIDRENRPGAGGVPTQNLILEAAGENVYATWVVSGPGQLPLKENSYVQITGVASLTVGESGVRRSSILWLRGPEDIQFLAQVAFWQRPEALRALGAAGVAVFFGVVSILALRRQVRQRTAELTEANRQLRHEIGERTRAEERVAQALEAEREIVRLKSTFVSMVSHEFRTPLGNIQSSAELLTSYFERLPRERREQLLRNIVRSTQDLAQVMEKVLLLSRVEAASYECQPEHFDLGVFCRQLVDELHCATQARCPIQLSLGELPEKVWADTTLLRHAFSNLLSNAVKYSPPGLPVEFEVQRFEHEVIFVVRDEGIGIPPQDLNRLFNAFYRGSNTNGAPGTGLGLVIVKRCVELHRGSIQIESKPERGTRVTVRVPLFAKEYETEFLRRAAAQE